MPSPLSVESLAEALVAAEEIPWDRARRLAMTALDHIGEKYAHDYAGVGKVLDNHAPRPNLRLTPHETEPE